MRASPAECNSALRPSTQAPLLWVAAEVNWSVDS